MRCRHVGVLGVERVVAYRHSTFDPSESLYMLASHTAPSSVLL